MLFCAVRVWHISWHGFETHATNRQRDGSDLCRKALSFNIGLGSIFIGDLEWQVYMFIFLVEILATTPEYEHHRDPGFGLFLFICEKK